MSSLMFVPKDSAPVEPTPEAKLLSVAGLAMASMAGFAQYSVDHPEECQTFKLAACMAFLFKQVQELYPNGALGFDELYAYAEKLGLREADLPPTTEVIQ